MSAGRDSEPAVALLTLGDDPPIRITGEAELMEALRALPLIDPGATVILVRDAKHYDRARREGDHWSAAARRGGWWTLTSFTAEITSDHSARQARKSRAAVSLRERLALTFFSRPPEFQLSTDQVRTIFAEFRSGRRFTIPRSGA